MEKCVLGQLERVRELSNHGHLTVFEVGDYALVTRVRKPDRVPKLLQTCTGPWDVVPRGSEHVRLVEDNVTGKPKKCP